MDGSNSALANRDASGCCDRPWILCWGQSWPMFSKQNRIIDGKEGGLIPINRLIISWVLHLYVEAMLVER